MGAAQRHGREGCIEAWLHKGRVGGWNRTGLHKGAAQRRGEAAQRWGCTEVGLVAGLRLDCTKDEAASGLHRGGDW